MSKALRMRKLLCYGTGTVMEEILSLAAPWMFDVHNDVQHCCHHRTSPDLQPCPGGESGSVTAQGEINCQLVAPGKGRTSAVASGLVMEIMLL